MASAHSQHRSTKGVGNKIVITSWDDLVASGRPKSEPIPKGWLDAKEVARRTGKSPRSVYRNLHRSNVERMQHIDYDKQSRSVTYYYLPDL